MQASKELWEHVLLLSRTDKESFEGGLNAWHHKWNDFLNERKLDAQGKKDMFINGLEALTEA